MTRSNVWHTAVTNQVLTFLGLNETEREKEKEKEHGETIEGPTP